MCTETLLNVLNQLNIEICGQLAVGEPRRRKTNFTVTGYATYRCVQQRVIEPLSMNRATTPTSVIR